MEPRRLTTLCDVSAKLPHVMSQFRHCKRKRTPVVFQHPVQRSVRSSRCAIVRPVRISGISGFVLGRPRSRLLSIYGAWPQRVPFQEGVSKTTAQPTGRLFIFPGCTGLTSLLRYLIAENPNYPHIRLSREIRNRVLRHSDRKWIRKRQGRRGKKKREEYNFVSDRDGKKGSYKINVTKKFWKTLIKIF